MWQAKYALAIPKNLGVGCWFSAVHWRQFPYWASVVRAKSRWSDLLMFRITKEFYSSFFNLYTVNDFSNCVLLKDPGFKLKLFIHPHHRHRNQMQRPNRPVFSHYPLWPFWPWEVHFGLLWMSLVGIVPADRPLLWQ